MTLQLKAEVFNLDILCNQIIHAKYRGEHNLRQCHMLILFKVSNHGPLQRFRPHNVWLNEKTQEFYYQNGNLAFILYKFTSTDLSEFRNLIDDIDNFDSVSLKKLEFQHYRLDLKTLDVNTGLLSEMFYEHFVYENTLN